jgi:molybdopterin molybdotransferase
MWDGRRLGRPMRRTACIARATTLTPPETAAPWLGPPCSSAGPEPTTGDRIRLISVEDALAQILAHVQPLEPETVPILDALDRVLTEEIVSDIDIPPFDNSAMDGYAVRSQDIAAATAQIPAWLEVIGYVPAGRVADETVRPGTAIRIMTGAPLPAGADAVVRFEDTSEATGAEGPRDRIGIYVQIPPGANVRPAGEDIRKGETVLGPGRLLRPQEIGVLASLGRSHVTVHRRPRVAILATGDELLEVHEALAPGKIRNSNEYSNAALVTRYGGVPVRLGIARDDVKELTEKVRQGLAQGVDLFLTSAGVSVGDYDVVKDVLGAEGAMQFWQVNMKPGKPLAFGVLTDRASGKTVPLIGLPGNPVSAMVSFEQFARPAILTMLGRTDLAKPTVQATLDQSLVNSGRRGFVRVIVEKKADGYHARTTGEQGSGVLTSMVRANGLALVPEGVRHVDAGTVLTVQMLDWPAGAGE